MDWNFGGHTEVYCNIVTPCVGVWIETYWILNRRLLLQSHPAWVCGLKLLDFGGNISRLGHTLRGCVDWNIPFARLRSCLRYSHTLRGCVDWNLFEDEEVTPSDVTPCVGVWIETYNARIVKILHESHPAWVCGLKLCFEACCDCERKSHPAWVCGLKHVKSEWNVIYMCHTLRGCVDWNNKSVQYKGVIESHPAWVCGLKLLDFGGNISRLGHTLRGCVDWNNDEVNTCIDNHSHTLRGCIWIEALFTRWSSLWKNCKHSASCVFLFKLL